MRHLWETSGKKNCVFYGATAVILTLFFSVVGENGYYEFTDSYQYIDAWGAEGIMPLYPLFIQLHRLILGEGLFLYGVVASQTILALISLLVFLFWIRRRFEAGMVVSVLTAIVSLVPLTLDFPTVLMNHCILTEALAYPLFYCFIIVFVEAIMRRSFGWLAFLWLLSEIMALTRSQMQICFAFTAFVTGYLCWIPGKEKKLWKKILLTAGSVFCAGAVVIGSEAVLLKTNGEMRNALYAIRNVLEGREIGRRENYEIGQEENLKLSIASSDEAETFSAAGSENITGQFLSVLMCRALYEMEEEDAALFSDPDVREVFLKIYEISDESGARYAYARHDLWMWQDIMNGVAGGAITVPNAWAAYQEESEGTDLTGEWSRISWTITIALLKRHWLRMLYHTLCMLPQGFICTVFFQKKAIYGLCHFYTLLVYLSAIALSVFGFRKKVIPKERCAFMVCMLLINIGMVFIICTVFFGMQRYLVYGFGAFYAAYLLMLESLWTNYGRALWEKRKDRF